MKDISIEYEGETIRLDEEQIRQMNCWRKTNGTGYNLAPLSLRDVDHVIANIAIAREDSGQMIEEEIDQVMDTLFNIREFFKPFMLP